MPTNELTKEQKARIMCNEIIDSLVGEKLAPIWWNGRNRAFGDRTPEEQWLIDWHSVHRYILQFYEYSY